MNGKGLGSCSYFDIGGSEFTYPFLFKQCLDILFFFVFFIIIIIFDLFRCHWWSIWLRKCLSIIIIVTQFFGRLPLAKKKHQQRIVTNCCFSFDQMRVYLAANSVLAAFARLNWCTSRDSKLVRKAYKGARPKKKKILIKQVYGYYCFASFFFL
jgi:hypothetical protein